MIVNQFSWLKRESLLSRLSASKIARAALFCNFEILSKFSREQVSQTLLPYSIMGSTIGFTNELKNRIRSLKGRFFLMFLRTPVLCDTFLHNVSIWSLIFKLLSTVDLTVSCNVRGGWGDSINSPSFTGYKHRYLSMITSSVLVLGEFKIMFLSADQVVT